MKSVGDMLRQAEEDRERLRQAGHSEAAANPAQAIRGRANQRIAQRLLAEVSELAARRIAAVKRPTTPIFCHF